MHTFVSLLLDSFLQFVRPLLTPFYGEDVSNQVLHPAAGVLFVILFVLEIGFFLFATTKHWDKFPAVARNIILALASLLGLLLGFCLLAALFFSSLPLDSVGV